MGWKLWAYTEAGTKVLAAVGPSTISSDSYFSNTWLAVQKVWLNSRITRYKSPEIKTVRLEDRAMQSIEIWTMKNFNTFDNM